MCDVLSLCVTVTFKDQTAKDKALQHMAAMSSAQIVSATAIHNKLGLPGIPRPAFPGAPGVSHKLGQRGKREGRSWRERRRKASLVPADMRLGMTLPVPFWVVTCCFCFFSWPLVSFPVSSGSL